MGIDVGAEVGIGVAVDKLTTTSADSWWLTASCKLNWPRLNGE